MLTGDVLLAML